MRGIGIGIGIVTDVLIPVTGTELLAVSSPSECATCEVFFADGGHLCAEACVAVVDMNVIAVAVACEVVCFVLDAFYSTYSIAVGNVSIAAEPARE